MRIIALTFVLLLAAAGTATGEPHQRGSRLRALLSAVIGEPPAAAGAGYMRGTGAEALVGQGGPGMGQGMMRGGMMGSGAMGMGMGGGMMMGGQQARGDDQSAMSVWMALLANNDKIKRTYTITDYGIDSTTLSTDPKIGALLQLHVAQMGRLLGACAAAGGCKQAPLRPWDPLFAAVFAKAGELELQVGKQGTWAVC